MFPIVFNEYTNILYNIIYMYINGFVWQFVYTSQWFFYWIIFTNHQSSGYPVETLSVGNPAVVVAVEPAAAAVHAVDLAAASSAFFVWRPLAMDNSSRQPWKKSKSENLE